MSSHAIHPKQVKQRAVKVQLSPILYGVCNQNASESRKWEN